MELIRYWKLVIRRWWLIAGLVVIALAFVAWDNSRQIPVYQTRTRLILKPGAANPFFSDYVSSSVEDQSTAYIQYMDTQAFGELVAARLGGEVSAGSVLNTISAKFVPGRFFDIAATHRNPALAQLLANTSADVLIAESVSRQQAQQEQIRAQQDPMRLAERERLRELQRVLEDELQQYREQIAQLEANIAELQSGPPSNETQDRLTAMRRQIVDNRSFLVQALTSLSQTQSALVASDLTSSDLDTAIVIEPASLPASPLPSGNARTALAALAIAIGLGVGFIFLWDYLDFTLRTPEELDALYGMPCLGVIGAIDQSGAASNGQAATNDLLTFPDSTQGHSPVAEAFRALRTNIEFANPGNPARSLLVTSAGAGEGKTVTASNLAVVMAQAGKRVILVDADLRKPRMHRLFGLPKAPGLSNLIVDRAADVGSYLQPTAIEGLQVLTSGMPPPNPAELLGSPRALELMQQLKERADLVIYDSSPAATVTDAVVIAARVDAVIQVVLAGRTRRDIVLQGKHVLQKVGAHVLGSVLNRVATMDLGYYSYYYGGRYYGSGQASEEEEEEAPRRFLQRRSQPRAEKAKHGSS